MISLMFQPNVLRIRTMDSCKYSTIKIMSNLLSNMSTHSLLNECFVFRLDDSPSRKTGRESGVKCHAIFR